MNITTARSKVDFNQQIAQLSGEQRAEKIIHLHQEVVNLNQEVVNLNQEVVNRDRKIQELEEQLAWFKRQIFGKRSERDVSNLNSQQLEFEGFEKLDAQKEEKKKKIESHERRKLNRNGQIKLLFLMTLPVKTTIIDISEEEKICTETGEPLVQIGVEITHKLAHKPGSYYIKEIIRP